MRSPIPPVVLAAALAVVLGLAATGCGGDDVVAPPADSSVRDAAGPDSTVADSSVTDATIDAGTPSACLPACDDGDLCNGTERCDVALGCLPGSAPICDDDDDCTTDTCEATAGCVNAPQDRDGDGFGDGFCGGLDCLDDPARGGASVGPGMPELCGNDLDDDCDGLRDYATVACVATNDTCATARVLPGPGSFSGTTRGLADDYALGCPDGFPGGTVADAVFRVTLTETRDIAVRVRGARSMFGGATVVALRRFAECATGPELREPVCGISSTLRLRSAAAGDYAIIVSGEPYGAFDLVVELEPPTVAPPIDVCDASTLDVSLGGSFRATRGDIRDDYGLTCNSVAPPSTAPDAVYRLTLDAPKDVRLDLQPQGALALMRACADMESTLVCTPGRFGGVSSIFRRALPAGTYFIVAEPNFDGRAGGVDDFVLDVRVSEPSVAPPADSCSSAATLTPGVELSTSVDALALDVGVSCASGGWLLARDVVYEFTTSVAQNVTLRVTTPGGPFMGDAPTLVLTSTCGDPTGERSCSFVEGSSTIERTWRSLPAGSWYVVVGTSASSGSARALLTLAPATPVPANDSCDGATELSTGTAVTFSPRDYEDDLALSCGRGASPDAIYRFTLPRRQAVTIIASPVGAAGSTRLALRTVCATGADLACMEGEPSSLSTTLDAGSYFVLVEADPGIPQVRLAPFFTDP